MQPTEVSVKTFLSHIADEQQRKDAERLCFIMNKITGKNPVMWGPSIIGFDTYHYKYESGREGDAAAAGFSPRKTNLTLYLPDGLNKYGELLSALGPHKTGKVCVYIKRLSDINIRILEELIRTSYHYVLSRQNDMHRAQ